MTKNLFFCEEWAASFPTMYKEKNNSFPIRAVNFCETFCACSPISLGQDLKVKNGRKKSFFSCGLLELEMVVLNVF
jgi:hypothetical protein